MRHWLILSCCVSALAGSFRSGRAAVPAEVPPPPEILDPPAPDPTAPDYSKQPVPIEPMEEVQRQLERVARATPATFKSETAKAMEMTPKYLLTRQVIYYLAYGPQDKEAITVTGTLLFARAVGELDPTPITWAAAPYLSADDLRLHKAALLVLYKGGTFEPEYGYDKLPHFSAIRGYLSNDGRGADALPDDPPPDLVGGMYGRDPSAALETMRGLYGSLRGKPPTEEEWALIEHANTHAVWLRSRARENGGPEEDAEKADLDKLSQSKFWWVRLYVAYLLRFHGELWDEQLVERLGKDENELVRECIEKLKADPTARKVRELQAEIRANLKGKSEKGT